MGENRRFGDDDGYPVVDLDSDDEFRAESSDDEIDVILHGTPEQKRRLRRLSLGQQSSSSEDDFEKEMAKELNLTMDSIKAKQNMGTLVASTSSSEAKSAENTFYDNSYFDSDSDEEGTSREKVQRQHPVLSNDDLLYDPNIDDDNQLWMDRQRRNYLPSRKRAARGGPLVDPRQQKVKPLPHSDAVLNCPACMTTLCLDCQRHAAYKNQYRAMFVMNCLVVSDEFLRYPNKSTKKSKKKNKNKGVKFQGTETENPSDPSTSQMPSEPRLGEATVEAGEPMDFADVDTNEEYNPVKCDICKTEVGVYDKDEIYHFFNVLASYG